jgi:tRNA pseudouridine13 synthase
LLNNNKINNNKEYLENVVGIKNYATHELTGIGGVYKHNFKDFIVKEILNSGKILEIKEDYDPPEFSEESKNAYTSFNLVKINKDTFKAIRDISRVLKVPFEAINYSGLKDKCSISVQRASIRGNRIEDLKKLKIQDIFIRAISPSKKSINLGGNWGNRFVIILRNIRKFAGLKSQITAIFDRLVKKGFPNYYGLQRFGTFRPNSHLLGRFLLERRYYEVFNELVLRTYPTESLEAQMARKKLKTTGNFKEAYKSFSKGLNYERTMIKHLIDYPNDYKGAVAKLSPYLIKLLISSFQSYIFNQLVSLRIAKGIPLFEPVKGDVINILDDYNGNVTQINHIYGFFYDKSLRKAIELNRASIVVPLIGYDTNLDEFPLMKELFKEFIKQENFDLEIFKSDLLKKHKFKGSFRPLTVKPLELRILDLVDDDLFPNRMKLKFEFSLQKGSYATVFLRELMK